LCRTTIARNPFNEKSSTCCSVIEGVIIWLRIRHRGFCSAQSFQRIQLKTGALETRQV
jgi:hypothetical protein